MYYFHILYVVAVAESLVSRLCVVRLYIGTPLNTLMYDCSKPLLIFDVVHTVSGNDVDGQ